MAPTCAEDELEPWEGYGTHLARPSSFFVKHADIAVPAASRRAIRDSVARIVHRYAAGLALVVCRLRLGPLAHDARLEAGQGLRMHLHTGAGERVNPGVARGFATAPTSATGRWRRRSSVVPRERVGRVRACGPLREDLFR